MNAKLTVIALFIIGLLVGMAGGAIIVELFFPQFKYEVGESPLIVAYEDTPLDFGYLIKNAPYEFLEYDAQAPAIQVKKPGSLTLNFSSVNPAHFTQFNVEVWNLTASPCTLVGSFNMANSLTFSSGIANYGYAFYFTTADVTTTGTITLRILFQS